jgi:membrane-associated phospholipid phosphatase
MMQTDSAASIFGSVVTRFAPAIDCSIAALFALGTWLYSKVIVDTNIRPYPGTTVMLPGVATHNNGDFVPGLDKDHAGYATGQIFVRDPQHMLKFVPDAESSCGDIFLRNLVIASVLLIGVIAHGMRREGPVAFAMICWAIGLTEIIVNPIKNYVGRLRPTFYSSCGWDDKFGKCTWDANVMPDPSYAPLDARHSFPSEHGALAMCVGLLLTLYASRVLRLWLYSQSHATAAGGLAATYHAATGSFQVPAEGWRRMGLHFGCRMATPLALAPACLAVWVGAARVHDNWHHPSDVTAGMLMGGACAAIAFSCYFGTPRPRAGYTAVKAATKAEEDAEDRAYQAMGL